MTIVRAYTHCKQYSQVQIKIKFEREKKRERQTATCFARIQIAKNKLFFPTWFLFKIRLRLKFSQAHCLFCLNVFIATILFWYYNYCYLILYYSNIGFFSLDAYIKHYHFLTIHFKMNNFIRQTFQSLVFALCIFLFRWTLFCLSLKSREIYK